MKTLTFGIDPNIDLIQKIFFRADWVFDHGDDGIRACLTSPDDVNDNMTDIAWHNGFDITKIRKLKKHGLIKMSNDDQTLHLLFDRQVALDNLDGRDFD